MHFRRPGHDAAIDREEVSLIDGGDQKLTHLVLNHERAAHLLTVNLLLVLGLKGPLVALRVEEHLHEDEPAVHKDGHFASRGEQDLVHCSVVELGHRQPIELARRQIDMN